TKREGVTVFLTTHNLNEAEKLCSRVAVIRKGKLMAEGPPEELRARKAGRRVEVIGRGFSDPLVAALLSRPEIQSAMVQDGRLVLELNDGFGMSSLVPFLIQAGVEIEEIHKAKASLEDVFLTLMEEEKPH